MAGHEEGQPRRVGARLGAALWVILVFLAAYGAVPLGSIETLFLLAPMVLVPLALDQVRILLAPSKAARWLGRVLDAAPLAAWFAAASFFMPPGVAGGTVAAGWWAFCLAAAAAGAIELWSLLMRERALRGAAATACMALLFLGVGGGWLTASRAAWPTGFSEPIPILTAVHFHYAGFLSLVLAACALRAAGGLTRAGAPHTPSVAAEPRSLAALARLAAVGIVVGVPTVAAGFVFSPALKLAGILVLAASVTTLALVQVLLLDVMRRPLATNLLAVSSAMGATGMGLAVWYGLGERALLRPINLPTMAAWHGSINALGFALCGLVAWRKRARLAPAPVVEAPASTVATDAGEDTGPPPRFALSAIILALALAVAVYHLLHRGRLEQSAALFIGLPALLAAALAATPRARTTTGTIMKAMTIGLLASGMFIGEGFICIVMAAPLFYVVGFVTGWAIDSIRGRRGSARVLPLVPLVVLGPASLEGVSDRLSLARLEEVRVERRVAATPPEVERALAAPLNLDRELPALLRLGFPRPVAASGSGLTPGSLRRVTFAAGPGQESDLVLVVTAAGPGIVRFRAIADASPIAHWLTWREAEVRVVRDGAAASRVVWTLRFERRLDPAFYFRPLERHGAALAASWLIDAAATP